jgi:hypothetical protein
MARPHRGQTNEARRESRFTAGSRGWAYRTIFELAGRAHAGCEHARCRCLPSTSRFARGAAPPAGRWRPNGRPTRGVIFRGVVALSVAWPSCPEPVAKRQKRVGRSRRCSVVARTPRSGTSRSSSSRPPRRRRRPSPDLPRTRCWWPRPTSGGPMTGPSPRRTAASAGSGGERLRADLVGREGRVVRRLEGPGGRRQRHPRAGRRGRPEPARCRGCRRSSTRWRTAGRRWTG